MKTKHEEFEVLVPNLDGDGVAERVKVSVPLQWDEELGEWLLTAEAHQIIESTKARRMGLDHARPRFAHILYPSSPLRAKQPDEQFAPEVEAVRAAGFEISLFSLEDFQGGEFRAFPPFSSTSEILYRGWMLSADEYGRLAAALSGVGAKLAIDRVAYLANHHLPQWYELLADLTPETRIYSADCDLEGELRALSWPGFFIKDYVKSLKTSVGSCITKPEKVGEVVAEMRRFRGVIEGGFCVRRMESFLPDTERRYFVLDGVPHASTGAVPDIVQECAKRLRSRFYSVDVVERADGQLRIVEVGDGQVSDLVGWTPERFASILAQHFLA